LQVFAAVALFSCEPAPTTSGPAEGRLEVRAVPLSLGPVSEVVYQVTVVGAGGQTVWTREVASTQFGDGAGAISYVGTCDPAANPNQVELSIVSMSDPNGPVAFANPAPANDPLVQLVDCQEQQDVSVTFEFTAAVAADTGFFDIAISFDDIFCSAKFDCLTEQDAPLELLFNPLTGKRERTAVMGFACTAGPGQDTYLWMDPVEILCSGGGPFDVNTAGGPGNLNPPFPGPLPDTERLLFQAAVYRGVELLDATTSWNKAYWNVAIGLNSDAFEQLDTCILHGLASASNGDFNIGQTPPNVRWPAVQWAVPLIEGGAYTCGRYQLDAGDEVKTIYTDSDGHRFYASYRAETQELEIQVGTPDHTTVVVCADDTLLPGEQTLCVITPRQDGLLVPVEYQDFDGLSASAGTVSGVSPQELTTSFTFTFTAPATSQVVTIDTGVGATTTVTVLGVPDNSSTLSCADTFLLSGASTLCTITPLREGAPVVALASNFNPSASPDGTVGPIQQPYGTALTFTYTAGATTGAMTISDGAAATTDLTVYATPDATSTVSCADDRLLPGHSTLCTVIPRANGVQILAVRDDFTVSVTPDGGVTALSPAVGTSFTFTFTAPGVVGVKTIDVGFGTAPSQTTVEVYSDTPIDELDPPWKPVIIDAGGQDRQIWLTWLPPSDNGGSPNLVYTVVCTAVDGNGPDGTVVTPNLEATVLWLENGKEYTCVVYASNEVGTGPPSEPTGVLIPNAVPLEPGTVVAAPLTVYRAQTFDGTNDGSTSVIAGAPAAFLGDGFVSPFDTGISGPVVAVPLTVYATDTYDGGGEYPVAGDRTSVVNAAPGAFTGDDFAHDLGLVDSGAVVASALTVYSRARVDDAGLTEVLRTSVVNAAAGVFAAALDVYATTRYDDGGAITARVTGMLVAAPGAFLAGGFINLFGEELSGPVVATPLTLYASERFVDQAVTGVDDTGVANAPPGAFLASVADELGSSLTGAVVALPLTVYGTGSIIVVDPNDERVSAVVAPPGAFAVGDPPVLGPLGPPTIVGASAGDEVIVIAWEPPVADGGSSIVSYTVTCTRTDLTETVTATVSAGFTSADVIGLTNDVAYTCTVHATNGSGAGPESDPTYPLTPNATPSDSGAVVATPVTVFATDRFVEDANATTSAVVAPPATFGADGFAADLGERVSGAVVAATLTVYAATTFDADDGAVTSAIVASPGAFSADLGYAGASATGAVVATPLMVGATSRFADPTATPEILSAVVGPPAGFTTEAMENGQRQSGPVVAVPLTVYRAATFDDASGLAAVSAVLAAPAGFTTAEGPLTLSRSGAVVATPLTVYGAVHYIADEVRVSAIVAAPGAFSDGVSGLGADPSGAIVAAPLTVYRADRFTGPERRTSAIVGSPVAITDDGTVTEPPGPPVITSATAGDRVIDLTWDPPVDGGGLEPTAQEYTVVCITDGNGPDVTLVTTELEAAVEGVRNGLDYYCTVTARNLVGSGPPSDPVGPLTPVALLVRTSPIVAAPLTVWATGRFDGASDPARVSVIVGAPAAFAAGSFNGLSRSGAVVAAPLTVNRAATFAGEALAIATIASSPAAFQTSQDDFGASRSGAVVAAPLTVNAASTYAAEEPLVPAWTSAILAAPAGFITNIDDLGTVASSAVVAAPLAVYATGRYADPAVTGLFAVSAVTSPPSAFATAADDLGASASGAVVATPLTVYATRSFDVADGATTSALVAPPAAWADDPALLPGGPTAPVIYSAQALDAAIGLAWRAPEDDGGSPVTAYDVVCESVSPAETVSQHFEALEGIVSGLHNGYVYTCVVYAQHADNSVSASFPSIPLTPGASSNLTGAVVALPLTVGATTRFADPTAAERVSVVNAAPAAFSTFAQDLGQQATGAVVAQALTVYSTARFDAALSDVTSVVDAPPAAFTATPVGDGGESSAGSVVAAPLTVFAADRYDDPASRGVARLSAIVAPPAAFSTGLATDLGASVSGAIVATALTVYASDRYTVAADAIGAVVAAPGAWQVSVGDALGADTAGAIVAATLTVYAAERYDSAGLPGAPTTAAVTAAPSPWLAELVFVSAVAPGDVSRAAGGATLTLTGFPLREVTDVTFYAPGQSVPTGLVTAGVTSVDAAGRMSVPITIDAGAPLGAWQVRVTTITGATSPINPEASQMGFAVTFTLSD
jgi:titin